MATLRQMIRENDCVELLEPVGKWPTGTTGTVVSERGEWKLVEISDDRGIALDYVSVCEPRLKLAAKHSL